MDKSISELKALWNEVLNELSSKIESTSYQAFFSDSYIHSATNNSIVIAVNSPLVERIINDSFINLITSIVGNILNEDIKVEVFHNESLKTTKQEEEETPFFFANSSINTGLTFDNFIVGECNRQAKQASVFIATNPGKGFNPLFIYSQSGLGKTHLLYAIANYIKENTNKKVLYCSADDFFSEFIKVVRGEKDQIAMRDFVTKHDILLIDDIQFFSGKTETENFFFQIFEKMYRVKKQIVITSDKHPNDLDGFEARLTSRFASGLVMNIDPPDTQTCVAILKSKIETSPLDINNFDENVLNFIAEKFSKSVRNLDEALNRIIFYTISFRPTKHISMEIAMEALQNLIDVREAKTRINENRIIAVVAEYYNLTPSQLTGKSRTSEVTLPRHIAMYLIREMLDVAFTKIGFLFGGKDHSTVMNGVKKVEKELKQSTTLQAAIRDIKNILED